MHGNLQLNNIALGFARLRHDVPTGTKLILRKNPSAYFVQERFSVAESRDDFFLK
jgi:hypothetical protein